MIAQVRESLSRYPEHWNVAKFSLYSIAFIGISLGAFVGSTSYLAVKPIDFQAPYSDLSYPAEISMVAEFLAVDPISRTMMIDWYPSFATFNCAGEPFVGDILSAQTLLDVSSPTFSAQQPTLPLFRMNSTAICQNDVDSPYRTFRTVTKLLAPSIYVPVAPMMTTSHSTLQDYPFDVYVAAFSFSVVDLETGAITAPNVTHSFGVAVNFEISVQGSLVLQNHVNRLRSSRLMINFRVERSKATKMFVVIVAITNWLTAAAFLIMCAATLVYRPHRIYSEMFVVPVGALFAFSSIRANLPGAPDGFGTTLDMYSTLPVLVIMSFCSFTLLLLVLYRRIIDVTLGGKQPSVPHFHSDQLKVVRGGAVDGQVLTTFLEAENLQVPSTGRSSMNETSVGDTPDPRKSNDERNGSGVALQNV